MTDAAHHYHQSSTDEGSEQDGGPPKSKKKQRSSAEDSQPAGRPTKLKATSAAAPVKQGQSSSLTGRSSRAPWAFKSARRRASAGGRLARTAPPAAMLRCPRDIALSSSFLSLFDGRRAVVDLARPLGLWLTSISLLPPPVPLVLLLHQPA